MIKHGGNLREAVALYGIPLESWLDLSTGINPFSWHIPDIPITVWQRFPDNDDALLSVARRYYGCKNLLPLAGSQAAIQILPFCRPISRIAIVSPCYEEHPYWWKKAGHEVLSICAKDVEEYIPYVDVLVIINPNNPNAKQWSVNKLLHWHQQLLSRGGWLVVDEAFIDSTPELSILASFNTEDNMPEGLIVFRSIGKFFGLAGLRLGFIMGSNALLETIKNKQGPWSISHPAQWLGIKALEDRQWQQEARKFLVQQRKKLHEVVTPYFCAAVFTNYFCYFQHPKAKEIKNHFAKRGILVRDFSSPPAIRLGLPANTAEFSQLKEALSLLSV